MQTSRRSFIKTTGAGTLGFSLLPILNGLDHLIYDLPPVVLPRTSPESQGISSKAISTFIKAITASGIQWHSFMLLRHGNVVAEGWWKPFDASYKHTLYSLSKSFTSTAVGLLVKEGKLSVDDYLVSFFPGELPAEVNENMKKIKIKHLLTMNSGHAEDTLGKMRDAKDKTWTKAYLELPVQFEPGTHFLYNTGNTYMLGAIVHKVTGQTLEEYLEPRLFHPLGIEKYDWEKSPDGLNTAGYGLRIKTEDIARFGQLYLQKGKWKGKEILTEAWVHEATSYQTKSQEGNGDWAQGYGYQFWRCKPGFYRGDGAYGQFCIVMPEQDAVLAITSESWDMQKSMLTAWENLLPAMQPGSIANNEADLIVLKKDLNELVLPVVKGSMSSSSASRYHDKKFKLDRNDYNASAMKFKFSKDGCEWIIKADKGETAIRFGWENWITGKNSLVYPFAVAYRVNVPSKIAGTATWINENTLQLNARFVEAIHGDKITCTFDGEKVSVTFLNTISENTKNSPEKRSSLSSIIE
ncbi:MAG: serine hydrolase [Bacteroidetes bacterium]|nr:MAG: serine hydrolase [Bacteroidota bacterium]